MEQEAKRKQSTKFIGKLLLRMAVGSILFALGTASILLVTLCLSTADAQQPKKITRIGYLSAYDAASESSRAEGVRLALRELGYIEGQNIAIEYRYAELKRDRYLSLPPSWCVSRLISSW
jgi:hypothetical protein